MDLLGCYQNTVNTQSIVKVLSINFTPTSTKLKGGILVSPCPSVCPSIRLSVCWQNCVCSVSSTILIGSFHICTSHQATSEGVSRVMFVSKLNKLKFWRILWICNFDFVFFWLGIQYGGGGGGGGGYPQNAGVLVVLVFQGMVPTDLGWLLLKFVLFLCYWYFILHNVCYYLQITLILDRYCSSAAATPVK